jgi:hypothetical protein
MSKVPHFDLNRKKLEKLRNKLRREGKKCSKIHKGKNDMFFFSSEDSESESRPEIPKVYKRKKAHY